MSKTAAVPALNRSSRFPGRELLDQIGAAVPSDHSRQIVAEHYIAGRSPSASAGTGAPWRVLDLGCGDGYSVDRFRSVDPAVQWVGLDVADSPEVRNRFRTDARFETFDGVSVPFPDSSFDFIFCRQVLEHVRYPEPLLAEVHRVLAPEGWFAGSTSQLEPYHSLSVWNFTPAGLVTLLRSAGLEPVELRPGIDAIALISRRLVGNTPPRWIQHRFDRWWAHRSPLNTLIDAYSRIARLDPQATNATKLVFCGTFTFLARRPAPL